MEYPNGFQRIQLKSRELACVAGFTIKSEDSPSAKNGFLTEVVEHLDYPQRSLSWSLQLVYSQAATLTTNLWYMLAFIPMIETKPCENGFAAHSYHTSPRPPSLNPVRY